MYSIVLEFYSLLLCPKHNQRAVFIHSTPSLVKKCLAAMHRESTFQIRIPFSCRFPQVLNLLILRRFCDWVFLELFFCCRDSPIHQKPINDNITPIEMNVQRSFLLIHFNNKTNQYTYFLCRENNQQVTDFSIVHSK